MDWVTAGMDRRGERAVNGGEKMYHLAERKCTT